MKNSSLDYLHGALYAEEAKTTRGGNMYGKIAALPMTGMSAAVAGPVSVLGLILIALTLVFAGSAIMGLLPKLQRRSH